MTYTDHIQLVRKTRDQILSCNNCRLGVSNRVPFSGIPWNPTIILVGEAPGNLEDQAGEPFVGKSGELLDESLIKAGTNRSRVFIANTVCCRPPGNRNPQPDELEACQPNLEAQISLAQTWVGVALGKIAFETISGSKKVSITAAKGKPFWAYDKLWIPTWHPAYTLRNRGEYPTMVRHLKMAVEIANGSQEYWFPEPPMKGKWSVRGNWLVVPYEGAPYPKVLLESGMVKGVLSALEWCQLQYQDDSYREALVSVRSLLG